MKSREPASTTVVFVIDTEYNSILNAASVLWIADCESGAQDVVLLGRIFRPPPSEFFSQGVIIVLVYK